MVDGKVLISVGGNASVEDKTAYLEAMDFKALAEFCGTSLDMEGVWNAYGMHMGSPGVDAGAQPTPPRMASQAEAVRTEAAVAIRMALAAWAWPRP